MKKTFTIASLAISAGIIFGGILATPTAHATGISGGPASGAESARGDSQPGDLFGDTGIFKKISDILLYVIGAISVIMIIIGGLRYVISNGDQKAVESAKNTILYAIIGIIVALLAYAAVGFVISSLTNSSGGGGGGSGGTSVI